MRLYRRIPQPSVRWIPFFIGVVLSVLCCLAYRSAVSHGGCRSSALDSHFVFSSADWKVVRRSPPSLKPVVARKMSRPRFAATELGIRERLLVVLLGQSSLSATLSSQINRSGLKSHIYMEKSRLVTGELGSLPNLTPYLTDEGEPSPNTASFVLSSLRNLTFHTSFDWLLFVPDGTYVNVFSLRRLVDSELSWSSPLIVGVPDSQRRCRLQAGVLVSHPAVQMLVQDSNFCNSIISDNSPFTTCLHRLTNLSCQSSTKSKSFAEYRWWDASEGEGGETRPPLHEQIPSLAEETHFNASLTVSPLLSERDAHSLHEHFAQVEIDSLERERGEVEAELKYLHHQTDGGTAAWPMGLPPVVDPPNRYQVPTWEYFTEEKIFKNHRDENYQLLQLLGGEDALDVEEIVRSARTAMEERLWVGGQQMKFLRLLSGYRVFNPLRGMEYLVDLVYSRVETPGGNSGPRPTKTHRVQLIRPLYSVELLEEVPYVKEDTDLTIVVPVESALQASAARALLATHLRICSTTPPTVESRQTRIALVARWVDAFVVKVLGSDLMELKNKCKSPVETSLLLAKPNNGLSIELTAMDEVVDHYGQQAIYVLLSPHSDYDGEFFDRVRINTIKGYQVFFPVQFAEFNPRVANNASRSSPKSASKGLLPIHKTRGVFDEGDFSAFAAYGVDYTYARSRLGSTTDDDPEWRLDLIPLFLNQSHLHVMRAIEPSLRVRYHGRGCMTRGLNAADQQRCQTSARHTYANKAQLAALIFS